MIKLAHLLSKYRAVVFVILAFPVLSLFISSRFRVQMIPENPHLTYQVRFAVPSRSADEIQQKVVVPTERIFNSLNGIQSISSKISHESAMIQLRFREDVTPNSAYLSIQEKMDQVKLQLPGDVESYKVIRAARPKPADIQVHFTESVSIGKVAQILKPYQAKIVRTEPDLESALQVTVRPDAKKMAENQLSLSQVVGALRSLGLSTAIGRNSGVMFETGMSFTSIEELKGTPVGSKKQRPITLSDVATIELADPKPVDIFKLWIDTDRTSEAEMMGIFRSYDSKTQFTLPYWNSVAKQSLQPLTLVLLCFLLQIVAIRSLKLPVRTMIFFAAMGLVVCVHFLFWKGLIFPPLRILDLHALALTLIIGSIFLAVLYARIRSFFNPESQTNAIPKTLEQAKLFALGELIPTFLALSLALWIATLPLLGTAMNLPSRFVAESFFYVGLPVLFTVLIVTPLVTSGTHLTKNLKSSQSDIHWRQNSAWTQSAVWLVVIAVLCAPLALYYLPLEVQKKGQDYTAAQLEDLRGHHRQLLYLADLDAPLAQHWKVIDKTYSTPTQVMTFSSSGKRFLNNLDLSGFAESLKEVQNKSRFGLLNLSEKRVPLHFNSSRLDLSTPRNLLVASSDEKIKQHSLQVLTEQKLTMRRYHTLRDSMREGHLVQPASNILFRRYETPDVQPTAWASYLISQYRSFLNSHWMSVIFLILLMAIYLNSFIRSFLVCIFGIAASTLVYSARHIFPGAFHVDSLWLLNLPMFLALFQILVLTRLIDIERSRGFDRETSLQEVRRHVAPTIYRCSWIFVLAIFVAGVLEIFPWLPSLGFWQEGLYIALMSAILLLASTAVLFPMFYLTSEEVIDRKLFKLYARFRSIWVRSSFNARDYGYEPSRSKSPDT